jgi:hypothetical protein
VREPVVREGNNKLSNKYSWAELAELFADRIEEHKFLPLNEFKRSDFISWFMKREHVGLRFDWKLVARCYKIWNDLRNDGDHFTLVVGSEGSGKSTVMAQFCAWISPNMDLNDFCFSMNQYVKKLKSIASSYKRDKADENDRSVIIDEGGIDLFSREAMQLSNRILGKTFFVQRFLNVHVGICIPYYWSIDSLLRKHRVKTLIMIKKKGVYRAVVGKGIKILNKLGSKDTDRDVHTIPIPYDYFWEGNSYKDFPDTLDFKEYEKYKFKHIKGFLDEVEMESQAVKMVKVAKLEKEFGIHRDTIIKEIKEGNIEGHQIGTQWFITKKAYEKLIMASGGGVS